jgi:hypothetical protein
MTILLQASLNRTRTQPRASEEIQSESKSDVNPVLESARFVYEHTNCVQINEHGMKNAARFIRSKIISSSYSPCTWRTHPLHICPLDEGMGNPGEVRARQVLVLNWIFLISSLNFSFWTDKNEEERYAVEWYERWEHPRGEIKRWTGYWSLVAALDRALEEGIPITDPSFYSSEVSCPEQLLKHIFRASLQSREEMPLLEQRIRILRENGSILCKEFGGSFTGFLDEFHCRHQGDGTALDFVRMVIDIFPSFRDDVWFEKRKVNIWKRAQILVAEMWAAFHPPVPAQEQALPPTPHPLFSGKSGPSIHLLTMFADYRVPQILHHLKILDYSPRLIKLLNDGTPFEHGSTEEVALRAVSILAVEQVRREILRLGVEDDGKLAAEEDVSSVLLDFYLWDLAKRVEKGEESPDGTETAAMIPVHRTRSIWY